MHGLHFQSQLRSLINLCEATKLPNSLEQPLRS